MTAYHRVHVRRLRHCEKPELRETAGGRLLLLPETAPPDAEAAFLRGLAEAGHCAPVGEELHTVAVSALHTWAARLSLPEPGLSFQTLTGRWALCRYAAGEICLNPDLRQVSPLAVEEVVLHELLHLLEPTHSSAFWRLLTEYMPDWAYREGLLRGQDIQTTLNKIHTT